MRRALVVIMSFIGLLSSQAHAQPPQTDINADLAEAGAPDAAALPETVSLTNAVGGERPKPAVAERERIQRAVVQGDPKLALALGASPMELGQALLNRPETGDGMKRRLSTATSATLVNVGGQVGLEINYVENGQPAAAVVVSRAFEGVTPSSDMRVLTELPRPPAP